MNIEDRQFLTEWGEAFCQLDADGTAMFIVALIKNGKVEFPYVRLGVVCWFPLSEILGLIGA